MSLDKIKEFLGVDSIGYLSIGGMLKCLSKEKNNYCVSCWRGNYPLRTKELDKHALE
jgi:amidophosphoribosyltransferase